MVLHCGTCGEGWPAARRSCASCGNSDAQTLEYFSAGDDCIAPPTFAACFTIMKGGAEMFADPELGAHWNLVHGSQRYDFGRPVRPGDVLTCTPTLTEITPRGNNQFATLEVDCRFVDPEGGNGEDGDRAVLATQVIVFFGGGTTEEG